MHAPFIRRLFESLPRISLERKFSLSDAIGTVIATTNLWKVVLNLQPFIIQSISIVLVLSSGRYTIKWTGFLTSYDSGQLTFRAFTLNIIRRYAVLFKANSLV